MNKHWDNEYRSPNLPTPAQKSRMEKESERTFWQDVWYEFLNWMKVLLFVIILVFGIFSVTFWNELPGWWKLLTW